MKNALKITAAALCCVALVACSQKGPAEAALKAAETSMNEVKAEGAKYAPEQTKGVLTSYASAQDAFNKGDYKTAMEVAQGVPAKAKDVTAAVTVKKGELTKTWTALAASVPGMVEQIKSKVDALAAMKKLPKDMDAAKLDAAKASLADITKSWGEASEAFKSGNLIDAVAKGNAVKTKAADEMAALGLTAAPSAAAAPAASPSAAPAAAAAAPAPAAKKY
jgi:predicted small lipoprotein YifL